jgi:hypothetical protein
MSRSRLFTVLVAFALLVVAPAVFAGTPDPATDGSVISKTPAKLCHPKKPLTCRASELAVMAGLGETEESVPALETPKAEPVESQELPTVTSELGRLCIPPRYLCKAATLI